MTEILIVPTIELVLLGLLAGIVGSFVVLSEKVFMTEAITHATFPGAVIGVVVGASLGWNLSILLFVGAFLCSILVATIANSWGGTSQSNAGLTLTFAFALGFFLAKWFAPLPIKVESFLIGSVLSVNRLDVISAGIVLIISLITCIFYGRQLIYGAFDPVGASLESSARTRTLILMILMVLTVVVLLPAVGNIVAIALLVAPAASAKEHVNRPYTLMWVAAVVGVFIALSGLATAVYLDLSVGGCIGIVAGIVFISSKLLAYARQ
ncbi:Manganese ABC transporter membrane protein [Corynebacterium kutscheri]|uniref:ABC-type Mn2+/Zn2+ transport system, permease component n=1 Tax=Corynebacterium kutscheri TaxID=35755 RepID=A0A0F6R1X9_9CORY|nr:metal ABC transporter permease [Corynebacterium kutscheri]AKE42135.1 ABC-type Mn2+/Zn2+ transport system, permease component [Corynebacterium kutscheri]VEH05911.1 Manganese ABC transporter membrane protein [Corynebacterium kutscheri]VEH10478.1 Manganese ABC transporter membrane protein [Corynebacterium kutscheri]VEH81800.1 Manganese ABC transporter membrane protein [Corynebacterium kutscheri]